jgi:putative ABC transport system permease protein
MLTGDRRKFLGIVLGVAFSAGLMAFQMSVFCGVLRRTTSQIQDIHANGIWVMDPEARFLDEVKPLGTGDVQRVRGVPGVAWAVPLYKDQARVSRADGTFRRANLVGLDDVTLIGLPRSMTMGSIEDLALPDAVVVDEAGFRVIWPGEAFQLGKVFEIHDHRAVLVGICKTSPLYQTMPIIYSQYKNAMFFGGPERRPVSFVLAEVLPGHERQEVCRRIEEKTRLKALTGQAFSWKTIQYYLKETAIPINFGITVAVGFVVGIAFAGQMFFLVTLDNLKHFASLKAIGTTNARLVRMILLQAVTAGLLGYCVGMGLTALLFEALLKVSTHTVGFCLLWQVMAISAVAVFIIMISSSLFSLRSVLKLEAATVFRG